MICPHCQSNLAQRSMNGDPMMRTRGLVIKSTGLALICPKCKGDVPVSLDVMNQLHKTVVLFKQRRDGMIKP